MTRKHAVIVALLVYPLLSQAAGTADDPIARERQERAECGHEYADKKLVRPSPKERVAVIKLLEQKPRAKTFIDADIKYLRSLLEKAVWTGAERRILREMWLEAMGQALEAHSSEGAEEK